MSLEGENTELVPVLIHKMNEGSVKKMCTSCDATFKIFSVEIVTQAPVHTDMELYQEIARRLFTNKIISNINVGNNRAYTAEDRQLFGFDLHLGNRHNPLTVTLGNVETALNGILDHFEDYYEMKIQLNA